MISQGCAYYLLYPRLNFIYVVQDPYVGFVIADFTTHGRSHIYGIPCPSVDYLDPMDCFCTFDVSKIIPKNMSYLIYTTFKPILTYIRGFDP